MKKIVFYVLFMVMAGGLVWPQAGEFSGLNVEVGEVNFPQAFLHAGKEYDPGKYWVVVTEKEGIPYFTVSNEKKELLFEEMAVIKRYKTKAKAKAPVKYQVKSGFLKGKEYFRVKISRPGVSIIAFFMVKQS